MWSEVRARAEGSLKEDLVVVAEAEAPGAAEAEEDGFELVAAA